MKYQVILPLPPKQCSSNFRGHTKAKKRFIASYRETCRTYYRLAKIPALSWKTTGKEAPPKVLIHLDFYYGRPQVNGKNVDDGLCRCLDEHNARESMKAAIDALQDVDIIPADTAKYLKIGETKLRTSQADHNGKWCVVMVLEVENK